jgi:hypothetical protein
MSALYAYICTRTTVDPYIPQRISSLDLLSRDLNDAFAALQGGYKVAGQISFFPLQRAVPSHLLCDGREVSKASFPELYRYLGDTEGTPANPANFVLPSFIGAAAFAPAPTAVPETEVAGSVQNPAPVDPSIDPLRWQRDYGSGDSGGRMNPIP